MATLIKNALIKQLSKFLKNVSSNQINISTFKGEGEMRNIQLDENVLMDLLELPTWLKITTAKCNKASFKVQWTKLKTNPIVIMLDKIELDMEIADPLRDYTTKDSKFFDKESTGAYGFIDKCIDAIQLNIDSITITIKSNKFNATFNMSNIYVYSTTPNWKITSDIRNTRLKDLEKEEIILFKEISWEICRLEAINLEANLNPQLQSSIKLIMNPSKVQIALKKKLTDKSYVSSTVKVLLNEIYWMANDIQLKSAIGTYHMISKLIKKAFSQKRKFVHIQQTQQQQQTAQNKPRTVLSVATSVAPINSQDESSIIDISKVFKQYDIKETSLHLQISLLNIHMYTDDNYSGNKLIEGGAMQILIKNLCIDHYPYHGINFNVKHWHNYNHTFKQRDDWSKNLIRNFITNLEKILKKVDISSINKIKLKNTNLLESCTILTIKDFLIYKVTTNVTNQALNTSVKKKRNASVDPVDKVNVESSDSFLHDIFKTNQFFVKQQIYNKRPFLSSNYEDFNLPNDTLFGQFFFSEFYFVEDINFPIPSPQFFFQISPFLVNIDFLTLLWLNALSLSLWREKLIVDQKQTHKLNSQNDSKHSIHCDTYLEIIMPKATLSIYPNFKEIKINDIISKRPNGIEIGFARICVSNQNVTDTILDNFKNTYDKAYSSSTSLCQLHSNLYSNSLKNGIKENKNKDLRMNHLAPCFKDITNNENISFIRCDLSGDSDITKFINTKDIADSPKTGLFLRSLNKNALNRTSKKYIWSIDCESMWIDMFEGDSIKTSNLENSTILQNCSFKLWFVNVWEFYNSLNIKNVSANEILKNDYEPDNPNEYCDINDSYNEETIDKNLLEKLTNVIEIEKNIRLTKKRSNSLSIASIEIKHNQDSVNLYHQIYSKLNLIGHIKELKILMNHTNLLFLLRLMDVIDLFSEQISLDSEQLLKYKSEESNEKNRVLNFNQSTTDFNDISSLNLSIVVDLIDIELVVNDYRKENSFIKFRNKFDQSVLNSQEKKLEPQNFEEKISEQKITESAFKEEKSSLNSLVSDSIKDQLSKEFEILSSNQLSQDFIAGYLKFTYGLSKENPNCLRQSVSINNNKNNDILSSSEKNSKISSVSYSFGSSSISNDSSEIKETVLATKKIPLLSQNNNIEYQRDTLGVIKSSLTSKNNNTDQLLDLLDDNDSVIDLQTFDQQDDTISILSYSAELVTNQLESTKSQLSEFQTNSNINIQNDFCNSISSDSSCSLANQIQSSTKQLITIQKNDFDLPLRNSMNNILVNTENNKKENVDEQIQTIQQTNSIKIKLFNLESYLQNYDSDISIIIVLDQIQLEDKKSQFYNQNTAQNSENKIYPNGEILILFKRILDDTESKNGMAKIILRNFCIEACIETLNGLADLVEDDDYYDKTKATVPISILIENSNLNLSYYENENKNISVKINKIFLNKLENNEIVVSELNIPFYLQNNYLSNNNLLRKTDLHKSIENNNLINELNNRSIKIANDRAKFKNSYSSQFASLIYILRETKDENTRLKNTLNLEKENVRLEKVKNDKIMKELIDLKDNNQVVKEMCIKNDESGVKNINFDNELKKFELERKQFECLLKKLEDENELLKQKLKKSEERINILDIENTSLIKKLKEHFP